MASVEELQDQVNELRKRIEESRTGLDDGGFEAAENAEKTPPPQSKFQVRRSLHGHFGKIYALHWGPSRNFDLISASQVGATGALQLINSERSLTFCFGKRMAKW